MRYRPFDDTVEDKLSYARAAVVHDAPYFASVVHGFIYVPIEGLGTMGVTSAMVLAYDPQWVKEASIKNLAADIVHEVNHFLRKHWVRAGNVEDPQLFNTAADLAINPDIRNAGVWELADKNSTRPAIFPEDFQLEEGLSTEEYYAKLLQRKHSQPPKEETQSADEGSGDNDSEGAGQKGGVCAGHCGSIAGNVDDPRLSEKTVGEQGRSQVEIQTISKRTAADIESYVQAKGIGSVPAGLSQFAKALIEEPHVRWQNELAHIIHNASGRIQAGGEDFSMSRPSKRSIIRGICRPGMIEHQPEVGFVRDSSASMNLDQLNACIREAYHIMQALGVDEAWFADADAAVAMPWKRVGPEFFRQLTEVHGRGGTDFRPAITAAEKLFPRPDLLIYCTDGFGPAPTIAPVDMAVVWCLIGGQRSPAKWGHPVIISEDPNDRRATPILPVEEEPDDD
jgi:predicted metal-dependent peptidase